MFDPLFPLMLLGGPIALLVLLRVEAQRKASTFLPLDSSAVLALIAVWGLTDWGLLVGVAKFGAGMKQGEFWKILIPAASVSVAVVTGGYCLVAWIRSRRARAED